MCVVLNFKLNFHNSLINNWKIKYLQHLEVNTSKTKEKLKVEFFFFFKFKMTKIHEFLFFFRKNERERERDRLHSSPWSALLCPCVISCRNIYLKWLLPVRVVYKYKTSNKHRYISLKYWLYVHYRRRLSVCIVLEEMWRPERRIWILAYQV